MIENLPATYTPGQAFSFQVTLPALTNFTQYSLQLLFGTDVTNPSLTASGAAASTGYPFAGSTNFSSVLGATPDPTQVLLTISDSAPASLPFGATTTSGTPLATITVTTGADLTGPINLSIGSDTFFNYNAETGSYPPPTDIPPINQGVAPPAPVPAPAAAILFGLGGLVLVARRRAS
jgi:hypothetical protein